jgi:hypothetical protein
MLNYLWTLCNIWHVCWIMYDLSLYVGYDSRSFVTLDGLLGLYGLKYDNVTTPAVAIVLVVLWIGRLCDTSYPNAGEPATTPASGAVTRGAEAHACASARWEHKSCMARGTWWARTGCWTSLEAGAQVGVTLTRFGAGPTAQAPRFLLRKTDSADFHWFSSNSGTYGPVVAGFLCQNVGK